MNNKVLFDTNILLDAMMEERPEWAYAVMLHDEIAYGRLEGCVAATSLKDVYYVLTKYAGDKAAREYVDAALDAFTLLEVDEATCRIASRSNEPDFKDGLVRACAERAQVSFIISRDEDAFRKSPIKRLSARDYAELFIPHDEVAL